MDKLYTLSTQISNLRLRGDDDGIDRLHRVYTPFMFVLFTVVITGKIYFGEPIHCWLNEKTPNLGHLRYADAVCWISNTYWVPYDDPIIYSSQAMDMPTLQEREKNGVQYYQWIPILLLLQALLFYVPSAIWRQLNEHSGIKVKVITELVLDAKNTSLETRRKTTKAVARYLNYCLDSYRSNRRSRVAVCMSLLSKSYLVCGRRYGNYVTVLYFIIKILFMVNCIGQLLIIDHFMRPENAGPFYGLTFISDFITNRNWLTTGRFPRVTMCDFVLRVMGNIHRHTVQCLLVINMFNEKVYIFIWFWLCILGALSIINFCLWVTAMCFSRARYEYLLSNLNMRKLISPDSRPEFNRFTREFLRSDGIFVLNMVAKNSNDLMAQDIAHAMWEIYKEDYSSIEDNAV